MEIRESGHVNLSQEMAMQDHQSQLSENQSLKSGELSPNVSDNLVVLNQPLDYE